MTCIVGIARDGVVHIAGDSGSGIPDLQVVSVMAQPKVFGVRTFGDEPSAVIGFTDSFRMGELLQHRLQLPTRRRSEEDDELVPTLEWIAGRLANAIREVFRNGGWWTKENEKEKGGQFLFGYEGRLFNYSSEHGFTENANGVDAVGSGFEVALGAMTGLLLIDPSLADRPRVLLLAAETAASEHIAFVRPPFHVASLVAGKVEILPLKYDLNPGFR